MVKVELKTAWSCDRDVDLYVLSHRHIYYELVYYYGFGKTKVGDTVYDFVPNSFMLIPPLIFHDETHISKSRVMVIRFDASEELPVFFGRDSDKQINKIVLDILSESGLQLTDYKKMIEIKLNELIVAFKRKIRNNLPRIKDFDYIIDYLAENFHEKISLKDCATQLSLSYDWFQHKFKTITGVSPQKFLLLKRLSEAENLLKEENLSCVEIAYRCGFSTSAQFSMIFKREYGISPLEYRKQNN